MALQFPSFEQSNPLLMGFRHGIGSLQGLQDIQRQGIENANLPEKLREALLAQQLGNRISQVNLDFLPREKQASLQHQLDMNRFYPQMQQANLKGAGLGHQLTQFQIDALKRQNTPEALAKAAELEQIDLDKKRAESQIAQERANMAKMMASGGGMGGYPMGQASIGSGVLRGFGGSGGSTAGKTFMTPEGPVSVPSLRTASKAQSTILGTHGLPEELSYIGKAYGPYSGVLGGAELKRVGLADALKKDFPGVSKMIASEDDLTKLKAYRDAQSMKVGIIDRMLSSYGLSSTNYFGQQMNKILQEIPWESAESYQHRLEKEGNRIAERANLMREALRSGVSLKDAYIKAGFHPKEAAKAAAYDKANGVMPFDIGTSGVNQTYSLQSGSEQEEPELVWR